MMMNLFKLRQGLLEEIGEPAVELLIVSAEDGDKNVRRGSIRVLGIIGDIRAVDVLINSLKDPNKWVRREASTALGNHGRSCCGPLIDTLKDDDWRVRGELHGPLGK